MRWIAVLALSLSAGPTWADSVAPRAADNTVAAELASFEIAEGYEVALFASETNGIANPIAMRFGPRGRLWVLCSLVYPQPVPATPGDDKLFVLEDTDADGRADRSAVFARGLDMPTGFALGDGGVYIGEGPDLVFLRDTDGDDRADTRELVFSGFGTGDTHQNINSFTWSPGGQLHFCQGLHAFSRVETPWGIRRLDEHGVWQLRPRRRQLHAFRGGSGQNPWGLAFGPWGEPFVKGNNNELSELLPVMVPTDRFQRPLDIGGTRIKSMICEIVDSPQLPADLQGDVLIAGYFGHLVDRLDMRPDGAGHKGELQPPLITSSHRSFRPVDIRTGPDGALYIADWFNPIIGHYQASLRHPDRDKAHGRVWRVTVGRPAAPIVDLTRRSPAQLVRALPAAPLAERARIRAELSGRPKDLVLAAADTLLDPADPRGLFEVLALHAWFETPNEDLVRRLCRSDHALARAYGVRVAGRWSDRLDLRDALSAAALDPHPRVRLEAVVALSYAADAAAMPAAARALEQPMDRFLTAALVQCAHALQPQWWPALREGRIDFAQPDQLAFVLRHTSGRDASTVVRELLRDPSLAAEVESSLLALLARIGTAADQRTVLDRAASRPGILDALAEAARLRGVRPTGDPAPALGKLLEAAPPARARAIRLAGLWRVAPLADRVRAIAQDRNAEQSDRAAAIEAWAALQPDPGTAESLQTIAGNDPAPSIQQAALQALAGIDLDRAATTAANRMRSVPDTVPAIIPVLFAQESGPAALAKALAAQPVEPPLADRIRAAAAATGRHAPELDRLLRPAGAGAIGIPAFDQRFVDELAREVQTAGDARQGRAVYLRPALGCVACHRIDRDGGDLGPELTAVGAGLPAELIIEAVLWPGRQVKEGFLATTIRTKDGRAINGYVQTESAEQIVVRDAASGSIQTIHPKQIAERKDAGTLMPPGLTAGLRRGELRDLVRFLVDQRE